MSRLCPRVAALVALLLCGVTSGAAQHADIAGVRVGFAGRYKAGYWTPVEVTLAAGPRPENAQLEIVVPDNDGVPSRVSSGRGRQIALVPGQSSRQMLFVKFGETDSEMNVVLVADGQDLARRVFKQGGDDVRAGMKSTQELLVMVGPPIPLQEEASQTEEGEKQTEVARLIDVAQLPTRWYGYEGVDRLILSTSQPAIYRPLNGARLDALDEWVRLGGRLLLCVGREGNEILAPDAPLARFVPGKFEQMIPLRQTSAIETYAETTERLDQQATDAGDAFRLDVPKLRDVQGRIEAYEGNSPRDLPLVVRAPYGLGEVVFVALDLDRPPFSTWPGREKLVARLLARPKKVAQEAGGDTLGQVTRLGYVDLAGQLHGALDQFAGVQLVEFWVVASLVVLYILVIGPLDYFFLKKVVRRMELTWITFPLVVVVFSAGAYFLAYWLKGTELRLNQVDLVDLDTHSGLVRGTSWSTLYSPQIDTFDLGLEPQPAAVVSGEPEVLLSWMGEPGSGVGGAGATLFTQPYDFSPPLDELQRLPISIWSTKSFVARWSAQAAAPVVPQLVDRGDHLLAGTLEIAAELNLFDCVLFYDRWAYRILDWQPGTTIAVDKQLEPQTIETYLRHITVVDEKEAHAPYDRSSTDLVRIMEVMMFHDLVGGEDYTGLADRFQGFADLSNHVRLGQAVLLGRAKRPGARLLRAGTPLAAQAENHLTFYRFVFPVDREAD